MKPKTPGIWIWALPVILLMAAGPGLGQDSRLLHHLVEALQGLLEGLVRTNEYFRQTVLPLPWPGIRAALGEIVFVAQTSVKPVSVAGLCREGTWYPPLHSARMDETSYHPAVEGGSPCAPYDTTTW